MMDDKHDATTGGSKKPSAKVSRSVDCPKSLTLEEYRKALPKRRHDARPVDTMKGHRDDKIEFLRKGLDVQKRQLNLFEEDQVRGKLFLLKGVAKECIWKTMILDRGETEPNVDYDSYYEKLCSEYGNGDPQSALWKMESQLNDLEKKGINIGSALYRECRAFLTKIADTDQALSINDCIYIAGIALELQPRCEAFSLLVEMMSQPQSSITESSGYGSKPDYRVHMDAIMKEASKGKNADDGITVRRRYLKTAVPGLAIITDNETLSYVFDSSSSRHARLEGTLYQPSRLQEATQILAGIAIDECTKSLSPIEQHTIRRLYSYLKSEDQSPQGDEHRAIPLLKVVMDRLGDLKLSSQRFRSGLDKCPSHDSSNSPVIGSSARLSAVSSFGYPSLSDASHAVSLALTRIHTPISFSVTKESASDQTDDGSTLSSIRSVKRRCNAPSCVSGIKTNKSYGSKHATTHGKSRKSIPRRVRS